MVYLVMLTPLLSLIQYVAFLPSLIILILIYNRLHDDYVRESSRVSSSIG